MVKRFDDFEGGDMSGMDGFSWEGALVGVALLLGSYILYRIWRMALAFVMKVLLVAALALGAAAIYHHYAPLG